LEESFIEHQLEPTDRNRLELKLAYLVNAREKHQRYLVEMFLFVPRSLGFDEKSYSKNRFYADINALLRFKTPRVKLAELAAGAEAWIPAPGSAEDDMDAPEHLRHIKRLACGFRSACQNQIHSALAQLDALDEDPEAELEFSAAMEETVATLDTATQKIRALEARWAKLGSGALRPGDVAAIDEYISLLAEDLCTTIVRAISDRATETGTCSVSLRPCQAALMARAVAEYEHRRSCGYSTLVRPGTENEHIPYQWRVLKRTVDTVLYLDVRSDEGRARLVRDLTGMVAAAGAMLFAVYAAIWAATTFGALSWPFIAASVGSYMIKDRLKEWGRNFLGRKFRHLIPDRLSKIRNHSGKIVGRATETMRTVAPDLIDPVVVALRHAEHPDEVAEHGRPEIVVHYTKEVSIFPAAVGDLDSVGLCDIIRLNMGRFRERMNVAYEPYHWPRADIGDVETIQCARVYHLNLVLRLTAMERRGERTYKEELVRVVMDQNGIKRVSILER
jgi:hypothetical protein